VITHAILNIYFLVAVARPGECQTREMPRLAHGLELVLIEEIIVAALMAEIEPVGPRGLHREALLQERAERRHAGAGPDHDDRFVRIGGQRKMLRLLHIDPHLLARLDAAREESRGDSKTRALIDLVAHRVDRERHATGIHL